MDRLKDRRMDRQADESVLKLHVLPDTSNKPQCLGNDHVNELSLCIPEAQPTFPDFYDKDCH